MAKGLKLKVRKFWRLIPTFVEVTGEKLLREIFLTPPLIGLKVGTHEFCVIKANIPSHNFIVLVYLAETLRFSNPDALFSSKLSKFTPHFLKYIYFYS